MALSTWFYINFTNLKVYIYAIKLKLIIHRNAKLLAEIENFAIKY